MKKNIIKSTVLMICLMTIFINSFAGIGQLQKPQSNSLSVGILSFSAQKLSVGTLIEWQTAQETFTLGFNVYRSWNITRHGTKINAELILAHPGSPFGFEYQITDSKKAPYYWLEIIGLSGESDWIMTTSLPELEAK